MKTLIIITALTMALGYFEPMGPPVCDDCPRPDVLPMPPPPTIEPPPLEFPPWQCYYVVIDGLKREICE